MSTLSSFDGDFITLTFEEIASLFFIKRFKNEDSNIPSNQIENQSNFILKHMKQQELLSFKPSKNQEKGMIPKYHLMILPKGVQRIDELQKNQVNNKNVFIAMSFAEDAKPIRDAIKQAIVNAGYIPLVLDEHHHNNQIVPEMLYQIRQSKFIIAELTHRNNGAYYEAGYAAGLGKTVIHLCQKMDESFDKNLHFDVRQINFVPWEKEEDIVKSLCERIQATIS